MCPVCRSHNLDIIELDAERTYVCDSCGSRWEVVEHTLVYKVYENLRCFCDECDCALTPEVYVAGDGLCRECSIKVVVNALVSQEALAAPPPRDVPGDDDDETIIL